MMINKLRVSALATLFAVLPFSIVYSQVKPDKSPTESDGKLRSYAVSGAGWQWPASSDGITYIPVCWENPSGWAAETAIVKNAVFESWQRAAKVNFYNWKACSPSSKGIRILITDTRPNSHIGKYIDGRRNGMELNFTFKNFSPGCQAENRRPSCISSISVHEFGHALGLMHEQERADSTCKSEKVNTGGWYLTNYDPNSVMNYCNPRWNNDGSLSTLDIKGIQMLYGARTPEPNGGFKVIDTLNTAAGQKWEHIVMDLGGSRRHFVLNDQATSKSNSWTFPSSGKYCYKIWSNTLYTDGKYRDGYGEGCYTLQAGRSYSLAIAFKRSSAERAFDIVLQAAN